MHDEIYSCGLLRYKMNELRFDMKVVYFTENLAFFYQRD